jgi:ribonuclease VapC
MIVDSSAVVAILRAEPEANAFTAAIETAISRISAVNYVEAAVVMDSVRDPIVSRRFDDLIQRGQIVVESVTEQQAYIARQAYRDFGRGSGHPARLNFADCFAYALAKDLGEPLLFKGDDFSRTDVTSALP